VTIVVEFVQVAAKMAVRDLVKTDALEVAIADVKERARANVPLIVEATAPILVKTNVDMQCSGIFKI